jgi:hypothetical protein
LRTSSSHGLCASSRNTSKPRIWKHLHATTRDLRGGDLGFVPDEEDDLLSPLMSPAFASALASAAAPAEADAVAALAEAREGEPRRVGEAPRFGLRERLRAGEPPRPREAAAEPAPLRDLQSAASAQRINRAPTQISTQQGARTRENEKNTFLGGSVAGQTVVHCVRAPEVRPARHQRFRYQSLHNHRQTIQTAGALTTAVRRNAAGQQCSESRAWGHGAVNRTSTRVQNSAMSKPPAVKQRNNNL